MADQQSETHTTFQASSPPEQADELASEIEGPLDVGAGVEHNEPAHNGPPTAWEVDAPQRPPLPQRVDHERVVSNEHKRWWQSITEPQREAWSAYRERGLDIKDTEKRDLLRAALSLHPNRDVAAAVIADLRKPA